MDRQSDVSLSTLYSAFVSDLASDPFSFMSELRKVLHGFEDSKNLLLPRKALKEKYYNPFLDE
jgi:hypothetical protein